MDKASLAHYIELINHFGCAIAIFYEDGNIIHLNKQALGILGYKVINLEVLPGHYVENEDFWENLHHNRTLFTHKALLKAGTETYKIRGVMHEIFPRTPEGEPAVYALVFEVREERIFGSVTLERIIENAGFVAFHWIADVPERGEWHARYVSNSVSKFGYRRDLFYDKKISWDELIYEKDRDFIREEIFEHVRSRKYDYTRQYRILAADGQVIPVHDYVHLIVDLDNRLLGVEVVIFDLLMETERNANLLLLESALNRSSNMVIVWNKEPSADGKHAVRYASDNVEHIGLSPTALVAGEVDYRSYIHPDDYAQANRVFQQFLGNGYQSLVLEYRIVNKKEQEVWIKDESNLVNLPDGHCYVESILTDISEAKRRELQLVKQQETLEHKLNYIESKENMLSDLSLLDFISKEQLQELQGAVAAVTGSYNAIIDLDGELITYPEGPEMNMGAFYDMFERTEYKNGYFELNKKLRREHAPAMMSLQEFSGTEWKTKRTQENPVLPQEGSLIQLVKAASHSSEDATAGVLVGFPLFVGDRHMATWINCAFTPEEIAKIDFYSDALWNLCCYMAKFVYSNTVTQQQAQKARCSEVQARDLLERTAVVRDILRKCNETNDADVLEYVLQKAGDYLKISRISLFRYEEGDRIPECWYEWDGKGMEKNIDYQSTKDSGFFEKQKQSFLQNGKVVLNGDSIPIRYRRILWENHIRAIVAMPVCTQTKEQQYIIFVESDYERVWTEDELSFMNTTVNMLQGFLQRMRSNVNVHDATENIRRFLELSRDYIYVKDEKTQEIIYINPRLEQVLGKDAAGHKCYEVFRRQSIRCMDCYQKYGECREICQSRMYSHIFKKPVRIREMYVEWEDHRRRKMVLLSPEEEL